MEEFNEDEELEKVKRELALRQENKIAEKQNDSSVFGDSFSEFVKNDSRISKDLEKHNRKKFKIFKKQDQEELDDRSAISRYQIRYDRETWFYKRHRDTIDKYAKKTINGKKRQEENACIVKSEEDETLRIGYFLMLFYVWFDLIMSALSNLIAIPVHIVRVIAELFAKMRKEIMWATIIIIIVLAVVIGIIVGINSLMQFANSFK